MTITSLIKMLDRFAKAHAKKVFTLRDAAMFAGESQASVGMALLRARRNGLVDRVGNVWFGLIEPPTIEEIALSVRQPSYISFESALYRRGVLSQSPRGLLTVAIAGRPVRLKTPFGDIEFIHLSRKIFFGFDSERVAYAEKAFLDMEYIRAKRGVRERSDVIYTKEMNTVLIRKFLKEYPKWLKDRLALTKNK